MRDFRSLEVWHESVALAVTVFELTAAFPKSERFGLASQMRRAATSISSNIAEGSGRMSPAEFAHFLGIAAGSASELDSQLELAARLGYVPSTDLCLDVARLRRRISALRTRVREP